VFLHVVVPGTAERSYGIHVARLAGLPAPVIRRAESVLHLIESGADGGAIKRPLNELPLFSAVSAMPAQAAPGPSPLEPLAEMLAETDPDALTPRDALDLLYRLRQLLP
jgi:DNA mismatch repair protein MutS